MFIPAWTKVVAALATVITGISDDRMPAPRSTPDRTVPAARSMLPVAVNLESIAEQLVRGRANVTIVGDSINEFGQTNWMYTGYLLDWRPRRWRQVLTAPASNSAATGSWVEYASAANYPLLRPGQTQPGCEAFAGEHTWTLRVLEGDNWTGRAISSGVNKSSFTYEGGMFIDADGGRRFLRSGGPERHRTMILAADDPAFRIEWTVRSRNSASGTGWTDSVFNHVFPCSESVEHAWFDHVIDGSVDGLGHVGTGLFSSSAGPITPGVRTALPGTVLTDLGTDTGLGLAYIGQGGWRTENHLLPYGDPATPLVPSSDGPYPGGYTDRALRDHILIHETTHFMLWIGTNNGGTDANTPWNTAEDVAGIMDRLRRVHAEARLEDPTLPEPGFLVISPYSGNDLDSFFGGYATALRDLAGADVAFIDLHQMVLDRFGIWSTWKDELLSDGVHPNLTGARTFARLIWREIIDAAGPSADFDRDGDVDGNDLGLMLAAWGCDDPGYADLDGDGCVDGRDFGLLLVEWTAGG